MAPDNKEDTEQNKRVVPAHAWKPGQSGNPGGRPKLDADTRRLRELTKEQFKELGSILLAGTDEDLVRLEASPDRSALTGWMINVIRVASSKGDYQTLDSMLNRLVGKVKDELDINLPRPTIIIKRNGEQVILGAARDSDPEYALEKELRESDEDPDPTGA